MAGRFEGLSELEWRLFVDIMMPSEPTKRGRGMPHTPFRKVVKMLLSLLIAGCRWCDTPRGPRWDSKSAAHRWLQRWQAIGPLATMQARVLGLAEEREMIHWEYGAVDGAFSPSRSHTMKKRDPIAGTIRARFAYGVLELLERLDVSEGEVLTITIIGLPVADKPGGLEGSAGGRKGMIDAEEFKCNIYADRMVSTRPEPRFNR